MLACSIILTCLSLPSFLASRAEGNVYSVGSSLIGSSGNDLEGTSFDSRSTLDYNQGGNADAESSTNTANIGWFEFGENEETAEEDSETTSTGGGGSGGSSILFDIDIIDFESPVKIGDFLDFTYFIKGVGSINNDVFVNFWIEKDGTTVSSGSTFIYMGTNEEVIRDTSLFLPTNLESGIYQLNANVSFGSAKAETHRIIELIVEGDSFIFSPLFDISFYLEKTLLESSDELTAITTLENFGTEPTPISLTFIILDKKGDELFREQESLIVETEEILRKSFKGLDLKQGKYTIVLETLYNTDVFDGFKQNFQIKRFFLSLKDIIYLLLILLLILLLLKRRRKDEKDKTRKKSKNFWKKKKQKPSSRGIHEKIRREVGVDVGNKRGGKKLFVVLAGSFLLTVFFMTTVSAALNVSLSDQGTETRLKSTGELLELGSLTVTIWDSLTGGNLIYNETFENSIVNGSWNVMLGENTSNPLPLSFGEIYYRDYEINGDDLDFTNLTGDSVERQFFYSPLGDISDVYLATNSTFSPIIGYTNSTYDGNLTNGSLIGYAAGNAICGAEFSGSHFCLKSEVLKTIANGNYSFGDTAWFQNGPPGFTANADDCNGWTTNDNTYLGPFWNWDANAQAGRAALTNCAQQKQLMCCGGSN